MMVLYVLMLSAIFIIRGKPYSGENICSVFVRPATNCFANMVTSTLAFCWNVVSFGLNYWQNGSKVFKQKNSVRNLLSIKF